MTAVSDELWELARSARARSAACRHARDQLRQAADGLDTILDPALAHTTAGAWQGVAASQRAQELRLQLFLLGRYADHFDDVVDQLTSRATTIDLTADGFEQAARLAEVFGG